MTRWKTIHCLLNVHWKHVENQIHCFLREDWQHVETTSTAKWNSSDNIWNPFIAYWMWCVNTRKKTSITAWNRAVTSCEKPIHCLVEQQEQHMEIHPNGYWMWCDNTWKTTSIVLWKWVVTTCGKSHPLPRETAFTTYGNPSTAY